MPLRPGGLWSKQLWNARHCYLFLIRAAEVPIFGSCVWRMRLCLATAGKQVPSGPDWIHEVKHDGYRMLVIRENDRVRLLSCSVEAPVSAG
jgi:hypothetical protein